MRFTPSRWTVGSAVVVTAVGLACLVWIARAPPQRQAYGGPVMLGAFALLSWLGAWLGPVERRTRLRWTGVVFAATALLLLVLAILLFH